MKNIIQINEIPIPNNMKTVTLGWIEIFLNEKVGILLIKSKAINIVRYGAIKLRSIDILKFDNSKIRGVKIKIAPIGDGIPSK